ncbi:MAG: hypothetical protein LBB63_03625 [Holosporaceae bacterium]|jgi:hypothetical protein|nr:hypothetical protein [Holosporaceae bacterium]
MLIFSHSEATSDFLTADDAGLAKASMCDKIRGLITQFDGGAPLFMAKRIAAGLGIREAVQFLLAICAPESILYGDIFRS